MPPKRNATTPASSCQATRPRRGRSLWSLTAGARFPTQRERIRAASPRNRLSPTPVEVRPPTDGLSGSLRPRRATSLSGGDTDGAGEGVDEACALPSRRTGLSSAIWTLGLRVFPAARARADGRPGAAARQGEGGGWREAASRKPPFGVVSALAEPRDRRGDLSPPIGGSQDRATVSIHRAESWRPRGGHDRGFSQVPVNEGLEPFGVFALFSIVAATIEGTWRIVAGSWRPRSHPPGKQLSGCELRPWLRRAAQGRTRGRSPARLPGRIRALLRGRHGGSEASSSPSTR